MKSSKVYDHIAGFLEEIAGQAGIVVELGCGSKQYGRCIAGRHVGIDLVTGVYPGGKADILADVHFIPLRSGSADLVFFVASLYIMQDTEKVISESFRILKKGGLLVIFDYKGWVVRRLRRQDPTNRHAFSSLGLARRLGKSGFAPRIHWTCVPVKGPKSLRWLTGNPLVKFLTYFVSHWIVLSARKTKDNI